MKEGDQRVKRGKRKHSTVCHLLTSFALARDETWVQCAKVQCATCARKTLCLMLHAQFCIGGVSSSSKPPTKHPTLRPPLQMTAKWLIQRRTNLIVLGKHIYRIISDKWNFTHFGLLLQVQILSLFWSFVSATMIKAEQRQSEVMIG